VLRFVRHLSLLPGLGPMLLAIVKTWHDATVILCVPHGLLTRVACGV
jgi:hypothetical protein